METITTNNNWKKKFIIIWTGQLFSILSSSIAQFSMVLWIGMETGSAEVLSYAAIAGLLPQILLGPMAGVFVDRWNRKWTMIGADSFVALCSAVIALLFYLDMVELWSIYLLLMLRSIGGAFHAPAMKSSIPLLAPPSELVRIAGINEVIQSVCTICGPMLGACLVVGVQYECRDACWMWLVLFWPASLCCLSLSPILPKKKPIGIYCMKCMRGHGLFCVIGE
ncbi:MFS transporter [Bacteroides thetaiotaomicron]|nr:MFS transporter [Bacteroides thetaiotaomicron]